IVSGLVDFDDVCYDDHADLLCPLHAEPKASNQIENEVVLAKQEAALQWCANASHHAATHGGKPWRYLLIPHDAIAENHTLAGLVARFGG
ncbi:MAG: putative type restriction enzyme, res subunit, partial [Proteobacteria bacterium]|nr:putative type restriction enzyme, res subunit [Pseudomonadota bacterium]